MGVQAIAFALALLGAGQQADPVDLSGVVVEPAPRTAKAARKYVDRVGGAPQFATSLATWRTPICIETVNLEPQAVLVLTSQIAARAAAVGVETKTQACRPNLTLIGTSDGRFTATDLVAAYPKAFIASGAATQGDRRDLRRFAERDAPVRWWTIAAEFDKDRRAFAEPLWGRMTVTRETESAPMFNQSLVRAMVQTLVIIDATETGSVPAAALADYVAMVVLAEVNPDADLGADATVLNLWEPASGIAGMTAWDERYLSALYCARTRQPGAGAPIRSRYQLGDIARKMTTASVEKRASRAGGCD
jgi:hypothetical protein